MASAGGLGKWVTHLSYVLYLEQARESSDKTTGSATGRRPVQWQRETLFHQHFRLVTVLGVLRWDNINPDKLDNGGGLLQMATRERYHALL